MTVDWKETFEAALFGISAVVVCMKAVRTGRIIGCDKNFFLGGKREKSRRVRGTSGHFFALVALACATAPGPIIKFTTYGN